MTVTNPTDPMNMSRRVPARVEVFQLRPAVAIINMKRYAVRCPRSLISNADTSDYVQALKQYGLYAGVLHSAYWITKRQTKKGPVISQDNIKGSYINHHLRHFMHQLESFFQLVSDPFRPLCLKPIKDIAKEWTDLPTNTQTWPFTSSSYLFPFFRHGIGMQLAGHIAHLTRR